MADYLIKCVDKPNRNSAHEHITGAGGIGPDGQSWHDTVDNIIRFIESKMHRFFTHENGKTVFVVVRINPVTGRKYIQTYADGEWRNNLLSLYECVGA